MKLSSHITLSEATKSQTALRLGILNQPSQKELEAMQLTAWQIFEPLRAWYGKPIGISSFYRSPELNKAIGGSKTSQHMKGQAIDIDADIFNNGISNREIYLWILKNLDFDQLIWEYGDDQNPAWVHVSYVSRSRNRKQILQIR
jgi:zinc D-Ala-D-Ala carboxypeptidase